MVGKKKSKKKKKKDDDGHRTAQYSLVFHRP